MMENDKQENQPVKLTVTFVDGHTKDYNIFMGVAAEGAVPVGKFDGRIVYMAPDEGFLVQGFSAIAATPEVVAALLKSMVLMLTSCIESLIKEDPIAVIKILEVMEGMGVKSSELFHKTQIMKKDVNGN